jgi:drug/metabolite transporter (DMT)-like permease
MNMEPVSSLILSWLVLGQRLAPVQLVGVALVVGAILFAQRRPNSG